MQKTSNSEQILFSPFLSITPSVKASTFLTIFLLFLQLALLFLSKSYSAILVVASSVLGILLAGSIIKFYFKVFNFSFSLAFLQGIISGMLLPESFPPLTVFFISFSVFLFVYHKTSVLSAGWVNAILLIVCVSWIVGMNVFPKVELTFDLLQSKNPSLALIENGVFPILKFDSSITFSLNNLFLSQLNVTLPEGYISLLWDTHSAIPAFRFNVLTLFSSIVLFSFDMMKMTIPFTFIIIYSALVRFISPVFCDGIFGQGDVLLALLTGGTLFCAVFFIQWYGTHPITFVGKICYGVLCAFFAFFIAGSGTSPSGMCFSILCANLLSPVIQFFEDEWSKRVLQKEFLKLKNDGGVGL